MIYGQDLAYIQAAGFGEFARRAAPEIVRLLRSAPIPVRRAIDLGCGAGVLAAALVEAGFAVTGIDNSADLLAIAATHAPAAHFLHGCIYDAEIPPSDAILAIGEVLSYHDEPAQADARVQNLFQKAAAALPSGGLLIFDVIETGQPSLAGRFWTSGSDWVVLSETTEEPAARTLVRKIETFRQVGSLYRRGTEVHRVRLFDPKALTEELAASGFAVELKHSYGTVPLLPRRRAFLATRE